MKVCLLILLLALFSRTELHAAEPLETTLPPVLVSSTRLPDVVQPTSEVPGKVIVVTSEDIEKLGAKTVQEVLQYQTGIVLFDGVGTEFQQTVDMRGFNAQPVTAISVFVDGVRVNEPDFNTINFDLIPIEDIERIEITRHRYRLRPQRFGRRDQRHHQTRAQGPAPPWIGRCRRQLRQTTIHVQHGRAGTYASSF
jgi:outer membrane cobalamin receptor